MLFRSAQFGQVSQASSGRHAAEPREQVERVTISSVRAGGSPTDIAVALGPQVLMKRVMQNGCSREGFRE